MNRRALLKLAPAVLAAGAVPAAALCVVDPAETPVMRAYREWEALYAFLNRDDRGGLSADDWNSECDRRIEIEDQMMEMPAQNARDIIAKVLAYTANGDSELPYPDHAFWAEARALVGGAA
ncbi:MAG: hypothetical protein Q4615_10395 [Paracoccus aminovorans]|nr:hypothetical protein [Paracoccus aminovorans]